MHSINGFLISDLEAVASRIEPVWPRLRRARLFITGGTGFLGQWLLTLLVHANDSRNLALNATCLTRDSQHFEQKCPDLAGHPIIKLIRGDIRDFVYPDDEFTHIIHGAADTSTEADAHPLHLSSCIIDGTKRVLDFAVTRTIKRCLFLSSGAIYGDQPAAIEKIDENCSNAPRLGDVTSAYAQSKRFAEHLFALYQREYGLETIIARGFAFAGPGMNMQGHFAIGNFTRDVVEGRAIHIKSDGQVWRSYLYSADAAAWIIAMLVNGKVGEAYNLGSDQAVSLADLATCIAETLQATQAPIIDGNPSRGRIRYVPSIDKAHRELGLEPWTGLQQQIRRTADWYVPAIKSVSAKRA